MKSLFEKSTLEECITRLDKLSNESNASWGKMNAVQMLAHCNETMKVANGEKQLKRIFISYILGSLLKKSFYNEKPVGKNSPTHPSFIFPNATDFEKNLTEQKQLLTSFQEGGIEKCTSNPHAFFGNVTKEQWGMGMYKHLNHHLEQFGV